MTSVNLKIMGDSPEEIRAFIKTIEQNTRYLIEDEDKDVSAMMLNDRRTGRAFGFFIFVTLTKGRP